MEHLYHPLQASENTEEEEDVENGKAGEEEEEL